MGVYINKGGISLFVVLERGGDKNILLNIEKIVFAIFAYLPIISLIILCIQFIFRKFA